MDDQEGSEVFEQIHARSFSGGIHVARLRPDVRAEHSLFTFTLFGEVRLEQTDESFDMRTSQPRLLFKHSVYQFVQAHALFCKRFAATSSGTSAITSCKVRTDIVIADACSKRLYFTAALSSLPHPVSALERRRACAPARRRRRAAR